jgi:hypothetical protein
MKSWKRGKGSDEKGREKTVFLSLIFCTERPTGNAYWFKRWVTSLFVFKLPVVDLHHFSDCGMCFVEWNNRVLNKLHVQYKYKYGYRIVLIAIPNFYVTCIRIRDSKNLKTLHKLNITIFNW